ncbi:MAG TPA: M56 family metallopeptidase [Terriglobales bacterium]|nr:M56 family metallopeptidase [Terriglobales bacterium]
MNALLSNPALPYWSRLLGLSLAVGAVSYFAGWLASTALAPFAIQRALRHQTQAPAQAARWLLKLRLLPLVSAAALVAGLCWPSYLWLEPLADGESWSLGFRLVALAGALLLLASLFRLARAYWSHRPLVRQARRLGRVLVVPGPQPIMALFGILRPRLLISRNLLQLLSPAQLDAGVRHERAHLRARDNFKRLLILASPAPGPRLRQLERAWARATEWAADDRAVAGDAHRSLTLASTLVAVARLSPSAPAFAPFALHSSLSAPPASFLSGALTADSADLAERVRRLLAPAAPAIHLRRAWPAWLAAALLLSFMLQPATLLAAHRILEHLVR